MIISRYRQNICEGEGVWLRLAIYPDNFTYLSVIGRISVQGEWAWQRWLQTRTCVQAHQWAANYFLVRMVVPGTKPVENPCPTLILKHQMSTLKKKNTSKATLSLQPVIYDLCPLTCLR